MVLLIVSDKLVISSGRHKVEKERNVDFWFPHQTYLWTFLTCNIVSCACAESLKGREVSFNLGVLSSNPNSGTLD